MQVQNAQSELSDRLDFVGLDQNQREALSALHSKIASSLDNALDTFYARAKIHPETRHFFSNDAHIQHAKERQVRHWDTIASAKFDEKYVEGVTTVGRTHARLGLEPRWYIGGYALILEQIIRAVIDDQLSGILFRGRKTKLADGISAVVKAALVDMDYAISVYLEVLAQERRKAEDEQTALKRDQDQALACLDRALEVLAAGNLTATIETDLAADFADLKNNYNPSLSSLETAISEIHRSVEQVAVQSEEISIATNDLARRTEQQASALEETSAAIEQSKALR